jgi:tight adherence protein C
LLGSSVGGARVPVAVAAGAWAGWRVAEELWQRARRAENEALRRALPDVLDRLTTCVLAGMSLERGLRLVAPGAPGRLGEALAAGLRALEVGVPRGQAYERIIVRAGSDEVRRLVAALSRAERLGTPVADVLGAQARDIRARLRTDAEAEARTAPVRLLFPTALCFLPAFLLLTVAPVVLSALKAFHAR